ncbi:hypothetical protein LIER_21909 [Lithospermum erythrorhizon]|uniref:Reverse transcriptase zinc-binding domain-containing protein n=1 Tax=Lithospermum erythrorhizon TaxID=34254 RepID=A0AAV3QS38_LITER
MVVGKKVVSGKVYDLLLLPRAKKPWMSTIWKHYIPSNYTFTMWLSCRNRLATTDNLVFFVVAKELSLAQVCNQFLHYSEICFVALPWISPNKFLGISR